jgi:hypothetical protein
VDSSKKNRYLLKVVERGDDSIVKVWWMAALSAGRLPRNVMVGQCVTGTRVND